MRAKQRFSAPLHLTSSTRAPPPASHTPTSELQRTLTLRGRDLSRVAARMLPCCISRAPSISVAISVSEKFAFAAVRRRSERSSKRKITFGNRLIDRLLQRRRKAEAAAVSEGTRKPASRWLCAALRCAPPSCSTLRPADSSRKIPTAFWRIPCLFPFPETTGCQFPGCHVAPGRHPCRRWPAADDVSGTAHPQSLPQAASCNHLRVLPAMMRACAVRSECQ